MIYVAQRRRLSVDQVDNLIADVRAESKSVIEKAHARSSATAALSPAVGGATGSARVARPSLEEVTLTNIPLSDFFKLGVERGSDVWTLKLTHYSSGVVSVAATQFGSQWIPPREKSSSSKSDVIAPDLSAPRFESSIARSKKTLRARCLELNADHMLTLTKRGKFSSCDELWTVFNRFNTYMTRAMPDKWRYVAVPELHSDGVTWHMHCAINGFIWAPLVQRIWQKALGGTGHESGTNTLGNVDLKYFRRYRSGHSAVGRIASYIAKYVGKGFGESNRGRRLFGASRELSRPKTLRFWCHDILRIDHLAVRIQQWLCSVGADVKADCFHWSRHRRDETLLMRGFILTTFLKVGA